ncbi:glycosyltransferase family 2 protein [Helicobacter sp. 11S02596-1]|uniref:glycosyltransferase family 2 protein n=1 Tax=Helicobacter sp. 11S02596-1 TaxID=1476194 RepID=UPI000BA55F9E|nr:glycosyltransferase family 2 protein [Helicobacter sp. 11S02596-1]PAF45201.1 hypothetical protein BJI48_01165 [Helicobacter sp. 11S02596-1]
MSPKISIIIPVYNVAPFITRCLDSCIHQTLTDIEIIIVDDCGSDDSIKIATEYASKDNRITILHHSQNSGLFQARKTGVENARGDYCMSCDGDDFLDLEACQIAYEAIIKTNVDIFALQLQHFPKTLKRIPPHIYQGLWTGDSMRKIFSKGRDAQSLCNKIIATPLLQSAYEALHFVKKPLLFCEDGLVLLVASFFAKSYFGQNKVIYYYCNNEQSMTRQNSPEILKKKYDNLEYILEILQHLKKSFPQYSSFIEDYGKKIASALILEARLFGREAFLQGYKILKKHHFTKKPLWDDSYIQAVGLSLRYHFRWQNLARLIACILGLKKLATLIKQANAKKPNGGGGQATT